MHVRVWIDGHTWEESWDLNPMAVNSDSSSVVGSLMAAI